MRHARGLFLVTFLLLTVLAIGPAPGVAAPEGRMTWAVHVSLAPTWFDPAETSGIITPFLILYALHDAVVKPMPGNPMASSLTESWTVSHHLSLPDHCRPIEPALSSHAGPCGTLYHS